MTNQEHKRRYFVAYLLWSLAMVPVGLITRFCSKVAQPFCETHNLNTIAVLTLLPLVLASFSMIIGYFIFKAVVRRWIVRDT